MTRFFLVLIKVYQTIGRMLAIRTCRFYPSCSEYTAEAIDKYGAGKGLVLGMWRILRCSPLSKGGHDPVK